MTRVAGDRWGACIFIKDGRVPRNSVTQEDDANGLF